MVSLARHSRMPRKTAHLQIRVTAAQKARLRQLARQSGQDVSAYVLAQTLPPAAERFQRAVNGLRDETNGRYAFAEVSDALTALGAAALERTVAAVDTSGLSEFAENYLAATVDHLCNARRVPIPAWSRNVPPLATPWFAVAFASLRPHLLRSSPVAFRRRNLFIDAGPDSRV